MKIVFVGPSLPEVEVLTRDDDIVVAGPALQGDILAAVNRGARVIGIVDGGFEYTAPVRHKEILYALSRGVLVFGAASMGALRAAECNAFGMVGVGRIFRDYESGANIDDADVALVHAPAELGYRSLSVALVNVRATLDALERQGRLSGNARAHIQEVAAAIFFKERTWRAIVEQCGAADGLKQPELLKILVSNAVDQKRADSIELLAALRAVVGQPQQSERPWKFNETFPM